MSQVTSSQVTSARDADVSDSADASRRSATSRATNTSGAPSDASVEVQSISAVTLATHDMARSVRFYRDLGLAMRYGGEDADFTSFSIGSGYLNLIAQPTQRAWSWWGRVIVYVSDVDAMHARAERLGYRPSFSPRDAEWGERYFHLTDPDGHELSFAAPLASTNG